MKHALTILILLPLLVSGTLLAPCAAATVTEKSHLVMLIAHADVPPYFMEESKDKGILVEVLKAVIEPLGYSFTIRRLPDKRGWDMLENGEVDVYASAQEWARRPDKFLWTDPFMLNQDVLLYPAKSTMEYTRPEDLYGRRVAGIKGFVYPALEAHFGPGKINRLDTASSDVMLKLLSLGRADAGLVNKTEIQWMFRNRKDLQPGQFRMDEIPVDKACYRFLFPKDHGWEPLVKQFNQRIRTMSLDGTLEAILDQYR